MRFTHHTVVLDLAMLLGATTRAEADTTKFHFGKSLATNDTTGRHPDALRAFIAGWLESVAFMRGHKDETVKIDTAVLKIPEPIVARVYDETFRMISADEKFDPTSLAVLGKSFVDMNMLPTAPDMTALYTEKFLPGTK